MAVKLSGTDAHVIIIPTVRLAEHEKTISFIFDGVDSNTKPPADAADASKSENHQSVRALRVLGDLDPSW